MLVERLGIPEEFKVEIYAETTSGLQRSVEPLAWTWFLDALDLGMRLRRFDFADTFRDEILQASVVL
jgi:hypothetical protein